jgi:peptidoglycan/LPS O-acetylase OafA/YrhL
MPLFSITPFCYQARTPHTMSGFTKPQVRFASLLLILFYLRIVITWGKPRGLLIKYIERIGENSFGIFLMHYFFISAFEYTRPLIGLSFDNLLFYPTLPFLTFICGEVSMQALYRLPGSAVLVGKRRGEVAWSHKT